MEEVEINTEKLTEIELKSDKNNTYLIEFSLNNSFSIIAKLINNNIHKTFSNIYSLEEIRKNKYFLKYNNISDIFNELTNIIYDNKILLKENENNLIINISLPKNQEIIFELKLNKKNNKNNSDELIVKLNKELNDVKNENIQLKNKIAEIKNNDDLLKNENIKLKKEIKQLKERINIYNKKYNNIYDLDSNIIKGNENYIKSIKNWINPSKKIKAELLYRLSEDGDKYSTFHELCDNKGPTLILFHVNDGNIVGIYTPLSWDSISNWKNDIDTFIFNLNKNLKCKKLISEQSIYCNSSYGPTTARFGYSSNSPINFIKHWANEINKYYDKGSEILPSNNEERVYELIEIEIYKIMIE